MLPEFREADLRLQRSPSHPVKASLPGEPAASGVHLTNASPLLTGRIVFSCSQKNFNVSENKILFSGNIFGSVNWEEFLRESKPWRALKYNFMVVARIRHRPLFCRNEVEDKCGVTTPFCDPQVELKERPPHCSVLRKQVQKVTEFKNKKL